MAPSKLPAIPTVLTGLQQAGLGVMGWAIFRFPLPPSQAQVDRVEALESVFRANIETRDALSVFTYPLLDDVRARQELQEIIAAVSAIVGHSFVVMGVLEPRPRDTPDDGGHRTNMLVGLGYHTVHEPVTPEPPAHRTPGARVLDALLAWAFTANSRWHRRRWPRWPRI